jgi:hypothetical protein
MTKGLLYTEIFLQLGHGDCLLSHPYSFLYFWFLVISLTHNYITLIMSVFFLATVEKREREGMICIYKRYIPYIIDVSFYTIY